MIVTLPASAAKTPASVLVLAQCQSAEMQPALDAIRRYNPDAEVQTLSDVASAAQLITSNHWFPDLVIICQHRPGEFSSAEAHTLLSLLPLARWISVRGSWCESDGRNGSPWPEAISVRARAAESRIALEQQVLQGAITAFPLTASRDETLEFDLQQPEKTGLPADIRAAHHIAIRTSDQELRRAIADLLAIEGFHVVPSRESQSSPTHSSPSVVLWDIDPVQPDRWPDAETFQQTSPAQATIAISSLAYPADVKQLQAIGVAAVIDKSNLAVTLVPTIEAAIAPTN